MVGGPLVQIAPTDADRADLEQDILGADLGTRHFAELDGVPFAFVVDDSGLSHRTPPTRTSP
jgi:hypothetical protein